jgi:hypothetical protein
MVMHVHLQLMIAHLNRSAGCGAIHFTMSFSTCIWMVYTECFVCLMFGKWLQDVKDEPHEFLQLGAHNVDSDESSANVTTGAGVVHWCHEC